jgi:hypothetical protein
MIAATEVRPRLPPPQERCLNLAHWKRALVGARPERPWRPTGTASCPQSLVRGTPFEGWAFTLKRVLPTASAWSGFYASAPGW